ncbi:hypothetical protein BY458DRAFT_561337 [Sporodiniella umbellata]|nr:hypothetical protein BY458DRAFT_561337 [Sporodiniella umbellata]
MEENNVQEDFFNYLSNYDLNDFNLEKEIPQTEAKTELKMESSPSPVRWAINIIKNGYKTNEFEELLNLKNYMKITKYL